MFIVGFYWKEWFARHYNRLKNTLLNTYHLFTNIKYTAKHEIITHAWMKFV